MAERRDERLVIGLMSGTSIDGIDAALVRFGPGDAAVETIAVHHRPYLTVERIELAALCRDEGSPSTLCRAGVALAELHAEAVKALLHESGVTADRISVIGFHGQTVFHGPHPGPSLGRPARATLQIGDAATLAERTGITVVSNFRARDMAAGGEGAPLVPFVDWLLFAHPDHGRVLLNIGGIANVTFLPAGCRGEEVLAFDTGPGNSLLDLLAHHLTEGRELFDRDGAIARSGRSDHRLLSRLMSHPYFSRNPPKSTGREEFGPLWLETLLKDHAATPDLMATLVEFTAAGIAGAIMKFWPGTVGPKEVIASGGGVHNPSLMRVLAQKLPEIRLVTTAEYGISVDFKEAIAFAILADRTIRGLTGNLPAATGARRAVVLGEITP